ncbi:60S ribosomal protein L23A [Dimargaris verticillata]|uniref:60S ribosomal protein L23A n=1 Tax=Dimargaris verticillata TaxID=2761393 RepID=A0A9W8B7E6_9FUNG|nr:60S ribosomal protein L23A [Dimargaris verticillata]
MDAQSKAQQARKAALKGAFSKKTRKVRTSTNFRRPHTLRLARAPKYPRKSLPNDARLDKYKVIMSPLTTEPAMKKIEENNTLVFLVDMRANKHTIRNTVKGLYDVDAAKVHTVIRPDGKKKAYVRLTPDVDALDIANKVSVTI